MSLAATLRKFKTDRVQALPARIIRETVEEFSERLATDWTPLGNPELWKSPPPADYRPGNLQSSWFFSVGSASTEKTDRTDVRAVNGIQGLADLQPGQTLYFANSADHAGAIEGGHSSQAPTGIMVNAMEFEGIAHTVARRLAR